MAAGVPGAVRLGGRIASLPALQHLIPGAAKMRQAASEAPDLVQALTPGGAQARAVAGQLSKVKEIGSAEARMAQSAREAARAEGKAFVQPHTRALPKPKPGGKGKVAGEIKPKTGSAESRVAKPQASKDAPRSKKKPERRRTPTGPSFEQPGALEAQLRASVANQPLIQQAEAQLGRRLTAEELQTAVQFLQKAVGQ